MCQLCQKQLCLPSCPNKTPPQKLRSLPLCVSCGEATIQAEGFYQINGFPYCIDCLEDADMNFLLRICETPKRRMLEKLGFVFKSSQ